MIRNTIPKTSTCWAQWNRIDFADGIFTESCFKVVINRPIPWLRDALFLSRTLHPFACMHAYLLLTTKSLQIFRKIQISGTDDHFLLVFIALDLLLLSDQLITNWVSLKISVSTLIEPTCFLKSCFILSDLALFFVFILSQIGNLFFLYI